MDDKPGGDPPVTHIEVTALPEAPPERAIDDRRITLHGHVFQTCLAAQRTLLGLASPEKIVAYLLDDFAAAFAALGAELKLYDPEGSLRAALTRPGLRQSGLTLTQDSYPLYELFEGDPRVVFLSLDDPRMFRVLGNAGAAAGAVMLPLLDGTRLVGVYHLAVAEGLVPLSDQDRVLLSSFAQLVSIALMRALDTIGAERMARIDPVTELANPRALSLETEREIARARRHGHSLAVLQLAVDDLDEVRRSQGEAGANLVLRHVANHLVLKLRSTDVIARIAPDRFSVLLIACGEPQAHDIAARLRDELKTAPIDNGRGAVFEVTLSAGLVCWDSQRHPFRNNDRLAAQLRDSAVEALERVVRGGGDDVAVSRIGVLMV